MKQCVLPNYCVECKDNVGIFVCIDGLVYGPCSYEDCYDWCMNYGECDCKCHSQDNI